MPSNIVKNITLLIKLLIKYITMILCIIARTLKQSISKTIISKTSKIIKKATAVIITLSFMLLNVVGTANATINIAVINRAGSNTNVLNSANGIPIVNINKPNQSGVSNNEYNNLDVAKKGLIFNNSSALVQTKLAGYIAPNNNLSPNENASLILNIVRSKRSELLGYMEVAGKSSDLIILNQNGIICDNCGFINVNRGVLSTGSAIFGSNGELQNIKVETGEIEIGKGGFNGTEANRIDLISQQLKLNGEIHGNTVNVVLGRELYNYNNGEITKLKNSNQQESYVISSSAFGGIYGKAITLVSSNQSVGVNIDFNMASSGSAITIDSAGNLTVNKKISSNNGDLKIKSKNLTVNNTAYLYSNNNTSINAENINLESTSELYSNGNYSLNGSNLKSKGAIYSKNNINLNFSNIDLLGKNVTAGNNLTINSNVINVSNKLSSTNINLKGANVNIYGELLAANINIDSKQSILINGLLYANNDIALNTNILNIANKIASKGNIFVTASNTEISGNVLAEKNINLNSKNFLNIKGEVNSNLELIVAANKLDLYGKLNSANNIVLNAINFNLNNGLVASKNLVNINSNILNLQQNSEVNSKNIELKAKDININNSKIGAAGEKGSINLKANNLNIKGSSDLTSGGNFTLALNSDFNLKESTKIGSNNNFKLTAQNINIYAGAKLSAGGELQVTGNNLNLGVGNSVKNENNAVTYLGSIKDFTLNISSAINIEANSNLTSKRNLNINANVVTNRGFIAGNNINFVIQDLSNLGNERIGNSHKSYSNRAAIYAISNIDIKGSNGGKAGNVLNSSASLQAKDGSININANNFTNTLSWYDIEENIGGWYNLYRDKQVNFTGWIYTDDEHRYETYTYETRNQRDIKYNVFGSTGAILTAGAKITINTDNFNNISSSFFGAQNIDINANKVNNQTIGKQNYTDVKINNKYHTNYDHMESDWFSDYWRSSGSKDEFSSKQYQENYSFVGLDGAQINAGSNIQINAGEYFGNGTKEEHSLVNQAESKDWKTNTNINNALKNTAEVTVAGNKLIIVDGNKFNYSNKKSEYLIESNPYFTDLNKFKGSKYFLELLGVKIDSNHKILGDSNVDVEVVTNQIKNKIDKELLNSKYHNKVEQLDDLIHEGLKVKDKLGLKVGESLTEQQLQKLNKPIVWWVSKNINGENVLVPTVFFPNSSKQLSNRNSNNSSTISAGNKVIITALKNGENNGTITANNGVIIKAGGNFTNNGVIKNKDNKEDILKRLNNLQTTLNQNNKNADHLYKKYKNLTEEYKKAENKYNQKLNSYKSKENGYNNLINTYKLKQEEYNLLLSQLNNKYSKYSGKVWVADLKNQEISTQNSLLQEKINGAKNTINTIENTLNVNKKELHELSKDLNNSGNYLNKLSDNINSSVKQINNLKAASTNIVKELENYKNNKFAQGVSISSKENLTNTGVIQASNIKIEAGKVNNTAGTIVSELQQDIKAKEINNYGGVIASKGDLNLEGNKITNESITKTNTIGNNNFKTVNTDLKNVAKIIAGHNLGIKATDLNIKGAYVGSNKDTNITINNLTLSSIILKNSSTLGAENTSKSVTNIGSLLEVGGNLAVSAANNINLIGSNINTKENAAIEAKGNLNVTNVYNENEQSSKNGSNSNYTYNKEVVGSNISTAGNLNLKVAKDVNLIGSNINTKMDATIIANNINVSGAYNSNIVDTTSVTKKHKLFSTKTITEHTHTEDYIVTKGAINSGGKTNLISSNNINIAGSNTTGAVVNIYAGSNVDKKTGKVTTKNNTGNINIVNMYNQHISEYTREVKVSGLSKNTFSGIISKHDGAITAKLTLGYTDTINNSQNSSNVVQSNIIAASENISIKTGKNFTSASNNIKASKDINIEATNINLLAAQNVTNSVKETSHEEVGLIIKAKNLNNKQAEGKILLGYKDYNKEEIKSIETVQNNLEASSGNINIKSGKDFNSVSSNIKANNNITIAAAGNINLLQAQNIYNTSKKSKHKELGITFNKDTIKDSLSTKEGLKAKVKLGYVENIKEESSNTVAASSNIISNSGSINLKAGNNFTSINSNIKANKDLNVQAINVNFLAAKNTYSNERTATYQDINFSVKIGNSYLDAANAAYDLSVNAKKFANTAKNINKTIEAYKNNSASSDAVLDSKLNATLAGLNVLASGLAANAAINAAINTAGSCGTALCTGLYVGGGLEYNTRKEYNSNNGYSQKGNNLLANNINIQSKKDLNIEGGKIESQNNLSLDAKNINIIAEESKDNTLSVSSSNTASAEVNSAGNVSANYSTSKSASTSSSTKYNNVSIKGKEINIKAVNVTAKGVNIEGNNIDVKVAENLKLETLQNTSTTANNNKSYGVGITLGGANNFLPNGLSGNSSKNQEEEKETWAKESSTIIANNKLNIEVGNKLSNIGGVIGSKDNNLKIKAKEIELQDLQNTKETKSKGYSFNGSIGKSGNIGNNNLYPTGSETIKATNKDNIESSNSLATIGKGVVKAEKVTYNNQEAKVKENGKIVVESAITKQGNTNTSSLGVRQEVNGDLEQTETETKKYTKRKLDAELTIDNRLLTKRGRAELASELKQSRDNLIKGAKLAGALSTKTWELTKAAAKYLTPKQNKELEQVTINLEVIKGNYEDLENKVGNLSQKVEFSKKDIEEIKEYQKAELAIEKQKQEILKTLVNIKESIEKDFKDMPLEKKQETLDKLNTAIKDIEKWKNEEELFYIHVNKGRLKNGKLDPQETRNDYKTYINKDSYKNVLTIHDKIVKYLSYIKEEHRGYATSNDKVENLKNQEDLKGEIKIDGKKYYHEVKDDSNEYNVLWGIVPKYNKDILDKFNDTKALAEYNKDKKENKQFKYLIPEEHTTDLYRKVIIQYDNAVKRENIRLIIDTNGEKYFEQQQTDGLVGHTYNIYQQSLFNKANEVEKETIEDKKDYTGLLKAFTAIVAAKNATTGKSEVKEGLKKRRVSDADTYFTGNFCTKGGANDCYAKWKLDIYNKINSKDFIYTNNSIFNRPVNNNKAQNKGK